MNELPHLSVIVIILVSNPVIQFLLCLLSILLLKKKGDILKTWRVITLSLVSIISYYLAGLFNLVMYSLYGHFTYFLFLFMVIYLILMFIPLRNLSSENLKKGLIMVLIMFVLQFLISFLSAAIIIKLLAYVDIIR